MASFSNILARSMALAAAFLCMQLAVPASAERIKDLGQFQGLRAEWQAGGFIEREFDFARLNLAREAAAMQV